LTGYILGIRSVVSLPTREQRALAVIEGDLRGGAPGLVSMFAIFTRLTRDDGAPRTESLPPTARRRLSRRAVEVWLAVPLAVGLVVLTVFFAVRSSAVHSCRPLPGQSYVAMGNPVLSCQAAQKP
jgi:Protein of unknown function (DUF3040)